MAIKGLDTGKAFLAGVLSKITDPGQRTAVEQLLANETFVTEIGNGVAGQSEIDRQLQQLRADAAALETQKTEVAEEKTRLEAYHGQLDTWYTGVKERLKTAPAAADPGKKNPPPAGLTAEQVAEQMQLQQASFLGFARDQNRIEREHFAKFGELLDLDPLLHHPQISTLGLIGAYELVHKDRLTAHAADQQKKHDERIAAEAVRKHLESQASMPYPSPTGSGSGSPLDALTPAKEPLVDAATAHYQRLVAERGAGVVAAAR